MRVIGGTAKGRRLRSPKGHFLRPTADRVKEALFNILPHDLSGLKVLDLFAGTGNLTIEALSRGAQEACLVDASRRAGTTIHENLQALGFSQKSRVRVGPVLRTIHLLARRGENFDLIFVDPPYEKGWIEGALRTIAREGLLREGGVLVAEHSGREEVKESYGPLSLCDQRRYGRTVLSFFSVMGKIGLLREGNRKPWRGLV
ncbi:MAG: 16S rRNA (guanine(966)-N(2))-methyltransferase RsmD [Candidatus Binatia bacterium]